MPRKRVEELEGEVRFHHIIKGQLAVLDARDCAHQWKVFHTTYSFCLVLRLAPCVVRWAYGRQIFEVDPEHLMMLMQPGETHANLARTLPGDFIVVQVGNELMNEIARGLGWRSCNINIKHTHQASQHPALLEALHQFHAALCPTLYGSSSRSELCTCHLWLDLHLRNLVNLVAAFIQYCVDGARELPPSRNSNGFISSVADHLIKNYKEPYYVDDVLHEADPAAIYNESYLLHEFSETYGVSPGEFQNLILASKTRDALTVSPNKRFRQLVSDVGWPGRVDEERGRWRTAHKHFKRTFGVTPGYFRRGVGQACDFATAAASLAPLLAAFKSSFDEARL